MKCMIVGVLLTLLVAYNMHAGQDWSAGQNKVPRQYIAEYLRIAYDEGRGADAAREYFAADSVDHVADAPDRRNGAPIHHTIKAMICDGLVVAVYHHIDANGADPDMDVVDIYHTKRGHIIERERIRQSVPAAAAAGTQS